MTERTPPRLRQRFRARMEQLARSRFALWIMSLLSFADACCSPIVPEVLYAPMVLLEPQRRWLVATACSAASVLGGIAGYLVGLWLWEHGLREFAFEHVPGFDAADFAAISRNYGDNAFLWVWLGGLTPLPYKVFAVSAGVCHEQVSFTVFLVASLASRFPRIFGTVWLLHRFGRPTFERIARRTGAIALTLLLLAAVTIALWLHWR